MGDHRNFQTVSLLALTKYLCPLSGFTRFPANPVDDVDLAVLVLGDYSCVVGTNDVLRTLHV